MTSQVLFREEDSGTAEAPITYTAYPGETPIFTGGLYFDSSSLAPASGELASRIPAAAKRREGAVRRADSLRPCAHKPDGLWGEASR